MTKDGGIHDNVLLAAVYILTTVLQLSNSFIRLETTTPRIEVFRGLGEAILECRYNSPNDDSILSVNWYRRTVFDKEFALIAQIPNNRSPVVVDRNMMQTTRLTYNRTDNQAIVKLIISKIQCIDEADYQCEIMLYGKPSPPRPDMKLVIYEKPSTPTITRSPSVLKENSNVRFTCTGYMGKPQGQMRWTMTKIVRGQRKTVELAGISSTASMLSYCDPDGSVENRLQLTVSRYDVELDCYILQQSIHGYKAVTMTTTNSLDVRYSVRNIRASMQINGRQVQRSKVTTILEGDTVTFVCASSGNPAPDYKWRFLPPSGKTLRAIRLTKGHMQADLTISNITMNHTGSYICVSQNFVEERHYSISEVVKIVVKDRTHYTHETSSSFSITSTPSQRLKYPKSVVNYVMVGGVVAIACIFVLLLSLIIVNCMRRVTSQSRTPRTYQGVSMRQR